MIGRSLYVEDGSVDVDNLQEELAEDTKIIVYRQGSTPPVVKELDRPARDIMESISKRYRKDSEELNAFLYKIANIAHRVKNTPKEIEKIVAEYLNKYGD